MRLRHPLALYRKYYKVQSATTGDFKFFEPKKPDDHVYIRYPYSPENIEKRYQEGEGQHATQEQEHIPTHLLPKSTTRAYICLFLGGIFGLHHYYMGHVKKADGMLKFCMMSSYALIGCYLLGDTFPLLAGFIKWMLIAVCFFYLNAYPITDFFTLPFMVRYHNRRARKLLKMSGRKQRFHYEKIQPYDGDFILSKKAEKVYGVTEDQIYRSKNLWKYF